MKEKQNIKNVIIFLILIIMVVVSLSCVAGSSGNLRFVKVDYPISCSAYLYDRDRSILSTADGLTVIKHLKYDDTFYGTAWSIVDLSDEREINMYINREIKNAGGDGLVNFKIEVVQSKLDYCIPFTLLPFWIGGTNIHIEGDVVKKIAH